MAVNIYESGKSIHDPEGNEWMIGNVWDYKESLCMFLVGVSQKVAGQMGGFKVDYEDGGVMVGV